MIKRSDRAWGEVSGEQKKARRRAKSEGKGAKKTSSPLKFKKERGYLGEKSGSCRGGGWMSGRMPAVFGVEVKGDG